MYTVQSLWTEARENLNIITLICSNRRFLAIPAFCVKRNVERNSRLTGYWRSAKHWMRSNLRPWPFHHTAWNPNLTFGVSFCILRSIFLPLTVKILHLARSGNPNHQGLPNWPAYNIDERPTMIFDVSCRAVNDPGSVERELWEDIRVGR